MLKLILLAVASREVHQYDTGARVEKHRMRHKDPGMAPCRRLRHLGSSLAVLRVDMVGDSFDQSIFGTLFWQVDIVANFLQEVVRGLDGEFRAGHKGREKKDRYFGKAKSRDYWHICSNTGRGSRTNSCRCLE